MLDNGSYQFTYGQDNRLHVVRDNGQLIADYSYNAQGQRTRKTTTADTFYYLYSPSGQLLTETDTLGNTTKNYLYTNGQLVAIAQAGTTGQAAQEVIFDNTDASFTGFWDSSTALAGYQGSDYQSHDGSTLSGPGLLGSPIDNTDTSVTITGGWITNNAIGGYFADNYLSIAAGNGSNSVVWSTDSLPTQKLRYDVYVNWVADSNHASNATYTIDQATGPDKTVSKNQQTGGGQWQLLGTYKLNNTSSITLTDDANGTVIADALTILPTGTTPTATPQAESATWTPNQTGDYELYVTWPQDSNNASDSQYTINHVNGSDTITVNQQQDGNTWNLLGSYTFDSNSTISLSSEGNGLVIADGLKLVIPSTSSPAGVFYVHNDHLGTPQTITDLSQQIVWQASYTPFGEATIITETITNNIRFPGQYFDSETNLHYNYFRYYDPSLGRYITSDPIGLAGGINTYAYVGGNPLRYSDPYGLSPIVNHTLTSIYTGRIPGPFGPICGPEGSVIARWIPDVNPQACSEHDSCYDDCAKNCGSNECKVTCDKNLQKDNWPYGKATERAGQSTYDNLKEKYGCDDCN